MNGPFHQKLLSQVNDAGVFVGEMPLPKEIKVIVNRIECIAKGNWVTLAEGETIQGLIVNKIEKLDTKERRLLEMNYPNVDFNQCYILDHGRRIANPRTTLALLIGGGMLIAVGGIVLLAGRKVM